MVNIEKLNETIEGLEIKSKDIETLIEKQNKLQVLVKEIDDLKDVLALEKDEIKKNSLKINKLIEDSKRNIVDMDSTIEKNINKVGSKLQSNVDSNKNMLEKSINTFKENIKSYEKNIGELKRIINSFEGNIENLNSDVIKNLNNITAENYKFLKELQNVLKTENNLISSSLSLEIKNFQREQEVMIENEIDKISNKIENNNKAINTCSEKIEKSLNNMKVEVISKFDDKFKKQQIINYVILVLLVVSIIINFIK